MTSDTVAAASTRTTRGTTLETMPPERRRTALARPDTGRDSTTSVVPVVRETNAENAAMASVTVVVPSESTPFARDSATSTGVRPDAALHGTETGAVLSTYETPVGSVSNFSAQWRRSFSNRVDSR